MAADLKADGWLVWARDAETLQRDREGFSEVITAISGDADLAREVEFRRFGAAVHGPLDCIVVHRRESAGAGLHQWASGHPIRQGTFGGEPFLFSLVVQLASPSPRGGLTESRRPIFGISCRGAAPRRWEHEATANGLSLSDLFRADAAARADVGRARCGTFAREPHRDG